jgi:hypothetical protein
MHKLGSNTSLWSVARPRGYGLGVATFSAAANPAGLIVSTGMKLYGEKSRSSKVKGRAKATAREIADVLKKCFLQRGWIN